MWNLMLYYKSFQLINLITAFSAIYVILSMLKCAFYHHTLDTYTIVYLKSNVFVAKYLEHGKV